MVDLLGLPAEFYRATDQLCATLETLSPDLRRLVIGWAVRRYVDEA